MIVLCNVAVVEIGDAKIKNDVEKKRKIQNDEIKAIIPNPNNALYVEINPKNPDRLDEEIQKK
jgi:hypothetical protein